MKIALDATYSLGRNLSGVGVYSQRILNGLPKAHPEARYLFCYRPHRILKSFETALPKQATRALLWGDFPRNTDLFHSLNQRVDSARHRRVAATFHDLFVLTGDYSTPEFRERFGDQARTAAQRSDLILAVSQFTADQVHSILGVERSRIRVVHHGVEPVRPAPAAKTKTILFVGAIQRRKNVARLVEAFERTPPGFRLVLAGSAGFGAAEILDRIERSPKRASIDVPGYVTQVQLESLYASASVFAFPSLDEGFGMPVLEAMARGIPVLTSNSSALKEISGGAALLVDPASVDAIAHGLNTLIDNAPLREEIARKGLLHAANFTWERTLEKTWAAYRELVPIP